jgi:hypothetical protein
MNKLKPLTAFLGLLSLRLSQLRPFDKRLERLQPTTKAISDSQWIGVARNLDLRESQNKLPDVPGELGLSKGKAQHRASVDLVESGKQRRSDTLYRLWSASKAKLISAPESKPWGLHEFTAADPDGNLLRVFYDFATPERVKDA